jgi:hypothetical protein
MLRFLKQFTAVKYPVKKTLALFLVCVCVMEEIDLIKLKKEFGRNKIIPPGFERVILLALSHYPDLKDIKIEFKFSAKHPVPYGTTPTLGSFFKKPPQRKYKVTLLTQARGPMVKALFRNLPEDAQIGVIGHELAHVAQYNNCSVKGLLRLVVLFPMLRKLMEQDADRRTIDRGLGVHLYKWATYVRSIPGYLRQRPQINIYYLTPHEILNYIRSGISAAS